MSTDRDRLAAAIRAEYDKRPPDRYPTEDALADALEGWRPPPRRIDDRAELEALPIGAIVLEVGEAASDAWPHVWRHIDYDGTRRAWEKPGSREPLLAAAVDLPVLVLRTPGGDS